jgi:hypothetical protein
LKEDFFLKINTGNKTLVCFLITEIPTWCWIVSTHAILVKTSKVPQRLEFTDMTSENQTARSVKCLLFSIPAFWRPLNTQAHTQNSHWNVQKVSSHRKNMNFLLYFFIIFKTILPFLFPKLLLTSPFLDSDFFWFKYLKTPLPSISFHPSSCFLPFLQSDDSTL